NDRAIAQVQLPCPAQVKDAGQGEDAGHRLLVGGQAESELPAGRVPGHAETLEVELRAWLFSLPQQGVIGAADVLKSAWPSPTGMAQGALSHIRGGNPGSLWRGAGVPRGGEIVPGAPIPAVNEEDHRMRRFGCGKAQLDELIGVGTVVD